MPEAVLGFIAAFQATLQLPQPCMQLLGQVPNSRQLAEAGSFLAHAANKSPRLAAALVTDELLKALLELPASLGPGCLAAKEVRAVTVARRSL